MRGTWIKTCKYFGSFTSIVPFLFVFALAISWQLLPFFPWFPYSEYAALKWNRNKTILYFFSLRAGYQSLKGNRSMNLIFCAFATWIAHNSYECHCNERNQLATSRFCKVVRIVEIDNPPKGLSLVVQIPWFFWLSICRSLIKMLLFGKNGLYGRYDLIRKVEFSTYLLHHRGLLSAMFVNRWEMA